MGTTENLPEYEPNLEAEAARAPLVHAMLDLEEELERMPGQLRQIAKRYITVSEVMAGLEREAHALTRRYQQKRARWQAINDFLSERFDAASEGRARAAPNSRPATSIKAAD